MTMQTGWLGTTLGVTAIASIASLASLRAADFRAVQAARRQIFAAVSRPLAAFDTACLQGLPEPAQRYFRYSIRETTPLVRQLELEMEGNLGLGTRQQPRYQPMAARQILALPGGLVWQVRAGGLKGVDLMTPTTSASRFWLLGVLPVVRAGGDVDHYLSAFGRVVAEAAIWAPATLLPDVFHAGEVGENSGDRAEVRWEEGGRDTACARVRWGELTQQVALTVDRAGRPTQVVIPRWSNENSDRTYRYQAFGGTLSDHREFGGYRLATRVEGGNHFGTGDYFPFYRVRVTKISFPELMPEKHRSRLAPH